MCDELRLKIVSPHEIAILTAMFVVCSIFCCKQSCYDPYLLMNKSQSKAKTIIAGAKSCIQFLMSEQRTAIAKKAFAGG